LKTSRTCAVTRRHYGHAGTTVTERVYRHQLRPVLLGGAVAMDRILTDDQGDEDRGDDAAEG